MGSTETNAKINLRFWGVRGSIPCAEPVNMLFGGNTSCVQIKINGCDDYLILDSGSGIRPLGDELAKGQQQKRGHIFITHAHWDHIQGFPFFKPIYDGSNQVTIHMPAQTSGDCKQVLTGQLTPTHFPVTADMLHAEIDYITQPPEKQDYGSFTAEFMLANHPVATAVYKIQLHGLTLIYAPDNELVPRHLDNDQAFRHQLIEFCRDADILIHDGNYSLDMYEERRNWGHSAWEDATEMAIEAGVKNLYLTHHDPAATDDFLTAREGQLLQRYNDKFVSVQLAREGVEYSY
ncbi:MAG: MBL fold metallo-hydrolase [Balneolales bacterium]|nr:MBL fold metallo-hydrolase [Balneolales bacterium]